MNAETRLFKNILYFPVKLILAPILLIIILIGSVAAIIAYLFTDVE